MSSVPFILFIPAYGNGGTGELVRCETLARALRQRWPQLRVEFVLPGDPGTLQQVAFPSHCHRPGVDPCSKEQFNNRCICELRPDLVVFDGGIRTSSLRLCRSLKIRTAFISQDAKSLGKAFRIGGLRILDAHWHQADADAAAVEFSPLQRLLSRASTTQRLRFDTYLASPAEGEQDLPREWQSQYQQDFVLLTPGGGGYRIADRSVGDLYLEVAEAVNRCSGVHCLTVLGPLYAGSASSASTHVMRQVGAGRLIDLMKKARVVVTSGGGSLNQAIACGAPSVAASLGGLDQPARIAARARVGLVRAAEPTVESLVEQTLALLQPSANMQMRQRLASAQFVDGIPLLCNAIAELLPGLA